MHDAAVCMRRMRLYMAREGLYVFCIALTMYQAAGLIVSKLFIWLNKNEAPPECRRCSSYRRRDSLNRYGARIRID